MIGTPVYAQSQGTVGPKALASQPAPEKVLPGDVTVEDDFVAQPESGCENHDSKMSAIRKISKADRAFIRALEKMAGVHEFIDDFTSRALTGKWNRSAASVSKTIVAEARRHKFDPVFLMAVIQNESRFKPSAVGRHGEIGLMQIRPATAKWIATKLAIPFNGASTLHDPVSNIKIGAAYLAYLRDRFDASDVSLYLAAYNMGTAAVHRALGRAVVPVEYPSRVMNHYARLNAELHDVITARAR